MTDSLANIINRNRFTEPPEIEHIKKYVLDTFNVQIAIHLQQNQIILIVPNAALAGALRPNLYKIGIECNIQKRLTIRIDS